MQRYETTLLEVRLENGGWVSGRIQCPPGLYPGPGQYVLAHAIGQDETLATPLFAARALLKLAGEEPQPAQSSFAASKTHPGGRAAEDLELAPALPASWSAGTRLVVRGPLGQGFSLPKSARRVALVALGAFAHRLLPLAEQALAQKSAVALYTRYVPAQLSPEVEVLPLDSLSEALNWTDYLAFDLSPTALSGLKKRFGLAPHTPMPVPAQVLVQVPMPCGGVGECGLCAVAQRRGYKLACKDGPVFDFNELDLINL
jgi:dihydroorotate dehydrogenase electron transfer subunit